MLIILVINIRLVDNEPNTLKELRGLKHSLDNDADLEMQSIYPEGYVFLNATYALAWSSFLRDKDHKEHLDEGMTEINRAMSKINSLAGRAPFREDLPLPYGAYYNGWSSYVLASKLRLEKKSSQKREEVLLFKQQCDSIAKAIQHEIYPSSYFGGTWPADAMVCVASLSLHDQLFEPKYKTVIKQWLKKVKSHTDKLGMVPHSVNPDGTPDEAARGSSMSLMLIFLREIDQSFAREQFNLYTKNFVDSKFGLTGIREYPKGIAGSGDIDSGPVIFGFGGAATIVGIQTLSLFGEHQTSHKIMTGVEALGFATETGDRKKYIVGMLPIADAFIAWSHSNSVKSDETPLFIAFHLCSLVIFLLLSLWAWRILK
jgi:hypothetical protein